MPQPIQRSVASIDLTERFQNTTAITGSPALAAETIVATLNLASWGDMQVVQGVQLTGWVAYTVGTSGTAATLRLRQTNVSGTLIASSGALSKTAASLYADDVNGFDAGAGAAVYVLTLQVTAGAAASTVSAVQLTAQII